MVFQTLVSFFETLISVVEAGGKEETTKAYLLYVEEIPTSQRTYAAESDVSLISATARVTLSDLTFCSSRRPPPEASRAAGSATPTAPMAARACSDGGDPRHARNRAALLGPVETDAH